MARNLLIKTTLEGAQKITDQFKGIGKSAAEAGTNASGAWRDVNGRLRDANGRFVKLASTTKTVNKNLTAMGKKLIGIGKGLTIGLTLPILAAAGGLIKLGADAQETRSLVETTFGDMTKDVKYWASTSSS